MKACRGRCHLNQVMNPGTVSILDDMNTLPCTQEPQILVTHYHVSNHNYVFCYMAAEVCMLFFKYEKAFSLWLESHMLICQLLDFDPGLAQLLWDQGLCSI